MTEAGLKVLIAGLLAYWGACALLLPVTTSDSILSFLSMPTIMLQATTSKNDVAVVFGVGCWLLAMVRYQRSSHRVYLFTAALSLAFLTGAKSSGLPILGVLVLVTAWLLRKRRRRLLAFTVFLAPLLLAFGSIETYCLSWRTYGRLPGPEQFVRDSINQDGIRGGAANFVRYGTANLWVNRLAWGLGVWGWLAGENAWTLPFLRHSEFAWHFTPRWDQAAAALNKAGEEGEAYALVLNTALPANLHFELIRSFPLSTYIVRLRSAGG